MANQTSGDAERDTIEVGEPDRVVEAATPLDRPATALHPAGALAGLIGGAALIHFVMAPVHAGSSQLEAALFAVTGWVQAVIAVKLIMRPDRRTIGAGMVVNALALGAWIYSRTRGLPFGAHPNVAESIDTIDAVCATLEGAFLLGAGASLVNRAPVRAPAWASVGFGAAALAIASVVTVSPDVAQHDHGTEVAAVDTARAELARIESQRCDRSINPQAYWTEADNAGIDTVYGTGHLTAASSGPAGAAPAGHHHGTTADAPAAPPSLPSPDRSREATSQQESRLAQLSRGVGEANDAALVVELAKLTNDEYQTWVRQLHTIATHPHDAAAPDDNGGHGGHVGPNSWTAITDAQTCSVLRSQLALARATALEYPTAADAKAAGWSKVTTYVPGIAAHYMNFGLVDDKFQVDQPEMILYDGEGDDAHVIGLSYYVMKPGDEEPKIGFAGGNDHFHRHVGLCIKAGLVIGDTQTSDAECKARGGSKQGGGAGWMSHAWVVPGCESPWGIFSGANPLLERELSAASGQNDGACSASSVRDRYDLSPGTNRSTTGGAEPESANPK